MAHLEKRASCTQRRSFTNQKKELYYIELAGKNPESSKWYMEKAYYYLKPSDRQKQNSNMYFNKPRQEYGKNKEK